MVDHYLHQEFRSRSVHKVGAMSKRSVGGVRKYPIGESSGQTPTNIFGKYEVTKENSGSHLLILHFRIFSIQGILRRDKSFSAYGFKTPCKDKNILEKREHRNKFTSCSCKYELKLIPEYTVCCPHHKRGQ